MTAYGRKAAAELAKLLPTFRNKREARKELFRRRNEALECLAALTQKDDGPRLDWSAGSLAELPARVFNLPASRVQTLVPKIGKLAQKHGLTSAEC